MHNVFCLHLPLNDAMQPTLNTSARKVPAAARPQLREVVRIFEQGDVKSAHLLLGLIHKEVPHNALVASYFGLSCILYGGQRKKGLLLCSGAVRRGVRDPVLWLNLAKAQTRLGMKADAIRSLQEGLRLQPDHVGLLSLWCTLGIRRRPAVPFLCRSNPINKALGKMTIGRREGPAKPNGKR
jgi:hypothetical protein